jgi:NDP-sugar pyrophosphorylase family protein
VLEQYRVRKAIILAAGFGHRLAPVSLHTPKPLVRVNGERIIDSLLDALLASGIESIYIVRGYK